MPLYDVAALAHALDLPPKQLDNLLSRNRFPGVVKNRRGLTRRFSREVAVIIKLASELGVAFDLPTGKLLMAAYRIERGSASHLSIGTFARLDVDIAALRASMAARLDEAVEVVGRRRRGRPPSGRLL